MIPGGQMVLVIMGSDKKPISSGYAGFALLELLGATLNDMALEGLIEEATLDQFNMPMYAPTLDQVVRVIEDNGSFKIEQFDVSEMDWDANIGNGVDDNNNLSLDKHERGKYVSMSIREVLESIIATHFGSAIIDELFERFATKVAQYLEMQKGIYVSMAKLG